MKHVASTGRVSSYCPQCEDSNRIIFLKPGLSLRFSPYLPIGCGAYAVLTGTQSNQKGTGKRNVLTKSVSQFCFV